MKRLLSIILVLAILAGVFQLPLTVWAKDGEEDSACDLRYEVYYTDMFSIYSSYLCDFGYINTLHKETQGVLLQLYDNLKRDEKYAHMFVATAYKGGLFDAIAIITDSLGATEFHYNKALDIANELVINEMFSRQVTADTFGTDKRIYEYFNKAISCITSIVDELELKQEIEIEVMEPVELLSHTLDEIGRYYTVDYEFNVVKEVLKYSIDNIDKVSKIFDAGEQGIVMLKSIFLAIGAELLRAEIIDDMLESAVPGTALCDGMTRLKDQLGNNIVDYIIRNYFENGMIKLLKGAAEKLVLKTFTKDNASTFGIITSVINISATIVYDFVLDVPDFSEISSYIILGAYADDLYNAMIKMQDTMSCTPMNEDTITAYENLWSVYNATNKAAWRLGKSIGLEDDVKDLNFIYEIHYAGDYDLYSVMMQYLIEKVKSIPVEERTVTPVSCYKYDYDSIKNKRFAEPTNMIDSKTIYTIDGSIYGDLAVRVYNSIGNDKIITGARGIMGDLIVDGSTFTIPAGAEFTVEGDVIITGHLGSGLTKYEGCLNNYGKLIVKGDLYSDVDYTLHQFNMGEGSELWLEGDFSLGYYNNNAGKVICNGTKKQTLHGDFHDLVVENREGIGGSINLNGHFDLKSNPFDGTVNLKGGGSFEDGSEYNRVFVGSDCTLRSNIPADTVEIYGATLTSPKGSRFTIGGDVILRGYQGYPGNTTYSGILSIMGDLTVDGDISALEDNYYYKLTMGEGAVLRITGDQNVGFEHNYGAVIFCGEEKQKMTGLYQDITVTNPEGVTGDATLTGHFDLRANHFDGSVNLRHGGSFEKGSNYNKVFINTNLSLNTVIPADTVEIYAKTLTIPEGATCEITGDIVIGGYTGYPGNTVYKGVLDIKGELILGGSIIENNGYSSVNAYEGSVLRLNGREEQRIRKLSNAYTVILENRSEEGVVFDSYIRVNTLFDHNRKTYATPSGASFTDYDNDGVPDNEDTVPEAVKGDANCDGKINSIDVNFLARILSGAYSGENAEEAELLSDHNGDGVVNGIDGNRQKRMMAGV